MIAYRTKYKGLLSEFVFLENTAPKKAIILCEGLPTAPKRQETLEFLAQQGFLVFYPRYRGTWESDGEFLAQNPTADLGLLVELVNSGNIVELFGNKTFSFQIEKVFVIGTSFGGSIALESLALPGIAKAVALSPVIDFKTFNKNFPEQDLNHLGNFMTKAFTNGYRFSPTNWAKLLEGEIINPASVINEATAKNALIIQSQDDKTVNYIPVVEFGKKHGIECMLLPEDGHFSFSKIPKKLWSEIITWLNK